MMGASVQCVHMRMHGLCFIVAFCGASLAPGSPDSAPRSHYPLGGCCLYAVKSS